METSQCDATKIHIGVEAAHQASIGENSSKRRKHVNVALYWVRDIICNNEASLHLVKTHELGEDFLTNAFPHEACANYCKLVGITKLNNTEHKLEYEYFKENIT